MNYANLILHSDIRPFEVVRRVSERTLEVREMRSTLDPGWKPKMVSGGFSGVCINTGSQRWRIESDPTAPIFRIRLQKSGAWKGPHGNFRLSDQPIRFHEYNF